MTARDWLGANGYEDVAALIDEVMAELESRGSKQRRNWWDVLAGGTNGKPITVSGREFPVLRVAQIRQGKPVTTQAITRNPNEVPPDVVITARWKKPEPAKARLRKKKQARRAPRRSTFKK